MANDEPRRCRKTYLQPEEDEEVRRRAAFLGLSLSEYLRRRALDSCTPEALALSSDRRKPLFSSVRTVAVLEAALDRALERGDDATADRILAKLTALQAGGEKPS